MDRETREALARAHDEIMQLRAANKHLAPKAHAYDTIAQLSRLAAQHESAGYSEDVAALLRKLLDADDQREES